MFQSLESKPAPISLTQLQNINNLAKFGNAMQPSLSLTSKPASGHYLGSFGQGNAASTRFGTRNERSVIDQSRSKRLMTQGTLIPETNSVSPNLQTMRPSGIITMRRKTQAELLHQGIGSKNEKNFGSGQMPTNFDLKRCSLPSHSRPQITQ